MLSVAFCFHYADYAVCHYAECHYAKCLYAEFRYAECRYAECHYSECRYAECHFAECRYGECRGVDGSAFPKNSPLKLLGVNIVTLFCSLNHFIELWKNSVQL
jgi:hypothetical protein